MIGCARDVFAQKKFWFYDEHASAYRILLQCYANQPQVVETLREHMCSELKKKRGAFFHREFAQFIALHGTLPDLIQIARHIKCGGSGGDDDDDDDDESVCAQVRMCFSILIYRRRYEHVFDAFCECDSMRAIKLIARMELIQRKVGVQDIVDALIPIELNVRSHNHFVAPDAHNKKVFDRFLVLQQKYRVQYERRRALFRPHLLYQILETREEKDYFSVDTFSKHSLSLCERAFIRLAIDFYWTAHK